MAITSAICNSFKTEILQGGHNLNTSGAPTGNTFKIALYSSDSATLSKATTAYTAPTDATADPTNTYEVTTTSSGYTGGGNALQYRQTQLYLLTLHVLNLITHLGLLLLLQQEDV